MRTPWSRASARGVLKPSIRCGTNLIKYPYDFFFGHARARLDRRPRLKTSLSRPTSTSRMSAILTVRSPVLRRNLVRPDRVQVRQVSSAESLTTVSCGAPLPALCLSTLTPVLSHAMPSSAAAERRRFAGLAMGEQLCAVPSGPCARRRVARVRGAEWSVCSPGVAQPSSPNTAPRRVEGRVKQRTTATLSLGLCGRCTLGALL